MSRTALLAVLLLAASCGAPSRVALDALSRSWSALRPYAEAGIQDDAEISEDAKIVLLDEVGEFTKTLEAVHDAAR